MRVCRAPKPKQSRTERWPAGDTIRVECDPGPYASALAALRANCPAYVPEDRWHQAVVDATTFDTEWGAQAHAFGWTAPELFGLHPVPDRPAANYDRLARLDHAGLVWLLRHRPVIVLTSTEAIMHCRSGASLTYRRQAPVPLDDMGPTP